MRRIARLERSIDLLRPRAIVKPYSPYLCFSCKHRATSFSTTSLRYKKVPFTEKIRRKIWGTDQPPGAADPYGDASQFDRTKQREKEEEEEERETARQAAREEFGGEQDLTGYEPAVTWDGLERVGEDIWDPGYRFNGFLPKEVMTDGDEITAALHRAVVEVSALRKASKPLHLLSENIPELAEDSTWRVQIHPSKKSGSPVLEFADGASLDNLVQELLSGGRRPADGEAPTESEEYLAADHSPIDPVYPDAIQVYKTPEQEAPTESEEDVVADKSEEDPLKEGGAIPFETYEDLVASWDPAWLQISLESPNFKFAVLKRMLQLSGVRVPDSVIQSSTTVQALLKHLIKPPKPKKLADILKNKEELLNLPNVTVFEKRVTPIDKEKQVGRWKLIEDELKERGLPVTGRA